MKVILFTVILTVSILSGCAMFSSWTSIPPPGGCDRCHTVAISTNWRATIAPVQLSSEDGTPPWQKEESVLPATGTSQVEQQLSSDERCFRCHREPNATHRERSGSYHHHR